MRAAPFLIVAVSLATTVGMTTPARAGEAVRLAVEFPPDVRSLGPGDALDIVQVVGLDANGDRVGFGGRSARLIVTAGSVRSVAPPFRFAYTAPSKIDGPTPVTFTATLEGAPSVRGTARLDILPNGPYIRLSVTAAKGRVDWGGTTIVTVEGESREGRLVPVVTQSVRLTVDGPGHVEFVRLGTYRFTAPEGPTASGRTAVRLRAHLEENGAVHGSASIALGEPGVRVPPIELPPVKVPTADKRDPPARAVADTSARDDTSAREDTATRDDTAAREAEPTAKAPKEKPTGPGKRDRTEKARVKQEFVWPGGRLRITAWRGRADDEKGTPMRRVRRMPEPGAVFALRDVEQRIRAIVLDADVTRVDAEWRVGADDTPTRAPPGTVRTTRNKKDQLVVVVEARPPENGDALRITLVLRRATGDLRDELVLRRKKADPKEKK